MPRRDAEEHLGGSAGRAADLFPMVRGANADAQYLRQFASEAGLRPAWRIALLYVVRVNDGQPWNALKIARIPRHDDGVGRVGAGGD